MPNFNFYFNVNADGDCGDDCYQVSENTKAEGVFDLAEEMHRNYPKAEISLEIVLQDGNEVYYANEGSSSVSATVVLYKAAK